MKRSRTSPRPLLKQEYEPSQLSQKTIKIRNGSKVHPNMDEDHMYMKALYHALPMDYITVSKLHNKLEGEVNQNTVRKLIHKMTKEGFVEAQSNRRLAKRVIHSELTQKKLHEVKRNLNLDEMLDEPQRNLNNTEHQTMGSKQRDLSTCGGIGSIGSELTRMISNPDVYHRSVRNDHTIVKMKKHGTPTRRAQLPAASKESFAQIMELDRTNGNHDNCIEFGAIMSSQSPTQRKQPKKVRATVADYGWHHKRSVATITTHTATIKARKNAPKTGYKHVSRYWSHLPSDLMRLVTNKLNYQERIYLRATCKNWNATQHSANDLIHDIPLKIVALILMKTSDNGFKPFFNVLIFWIKDQNDTTIRALLDHIPIQELYQWGHDAYRPNESMFTYFMTMAQRLGNFDAEFYWVCKSVVLRKHVYYDILDTSYKIIENLSRKGHMLSLLFKNMMDIYFFPKKRTDAVTAIVLMISTPGTKQKICDMILALKKVGGQIYPDTIFDEISGNPICNAPIPNEDNHYNPDGYPVHPDQMDDYTCLQCKVALLMGCLSAYLTESVDFYLDLYQN